MYLGFDPAAQPSNTCRSSFSRAFHGTDTFQSPIARMCRLFQKQLSRVEHARCQQRYAHDPSGAFFLTHI